MKAEQQSMQQTMTEAMQQTMKEAMRESFQASAAARVSHAGTEPAASVRSAAPVGPSLARETAPPCGGGKGTGHTATEFCPPECKVEPVESEGGSVDSDSESEPKVATESLSSSTIFLALDGVEESADAGAGVGVARLRLTTGVMASMYSRR